jgi:hypothetical protein
LPSKKTKKALERIKKVQILQVYPHPQNSNISVIIAGSPKSVKDEYGNIQKGVSLHKLKVNLKRKTIKCSCPHFRKHRICKHVLKVLLILHKGEPTFLYRKLINPQYKANRGITSPKRAKKSITDINLLKCEPRK